MRHNNLIMIHQRFRRDGDHEMHRNISLHTLTEMNMNQEVTLAQFNADIKLTHKGKHLKVCGL